MQTVTILGSTGSIGVNTLSTISQHRDKFKVRVLTAHKNKDLLIEQAKTFLPEHVVIDDKYYHEVKAALSPLKINVLSGKNGLDEVTQIPVDKVISAIVGLAGLGPTFNAVSHNPIVAIANKESIIAGGSLLMNLAQKKECTILPIDSEHNALHQCLQNKEEVLSMTLTASGGPFLGKKRHDLENITWQQAVKHPNWSMGVKNSIDSATLANKGLEVLETAVLFNKKAEGIKVLVHPESIVHAMIHYTDNSYIANLYAPDMRVPISHVLGYPKRLENNCKLIDFSQLNFFEPDHETFPALSLAYRSLKEGKGIIFNAANEGAVNKFIRGEIGFLDIASHIEKALDQFDTPQLNNLDDIESFNNMVLNF